MSSIRLAQTDEPSVTLAGRHKLWVDACSLDWTVKDSNGDKRYLTRFNGITSVTAIVPDGGVEGPTIGYPSPQFGQVYIIKTNSGSLHPSWGGGITDLANNDLFYRDSVNSTWIKALTPYEGYKVYNQDDGNWYTFKSGSWTADKSVQISTKVSGQALDSFALNKVDLSSGLVTVYLPDATLHVGNEIEVKIISNSSNALTIEAILGQTIDGSASVVDNTAYKYFKFTSDGVNWMRTY